MAKLETIAGNKVKKSSFGLPGDRKEPVDMKARAANQKARIPKIPKVK